MQPKSHLHRCRTVPLSAQPLVVRFTVSVLVCIAGPARSDAQRSAPLSPAVMEQVERQLIQLPAPPPWPSPHAAIWTVDDIRAEFARITDTPPEVHAVHEAFLRTDAGWLTAFNRWFSALRGKLKIRFEDQVWDCDNFANCFVAFADLLALKAGEQRGSVCVGWASVYYETPFAGVGRGAHAVVLAGTAEGLFIIEPQDGTTVPLRNFPNRNTVVAVYF